MSCLGGYEITHIYFIANLPLSFPFTHSPLLLLPPPPPQDTHSSATLWMPFIIPLLLPLSTLFLLGSHVTNSHHLPLIIPCLLINPTIWLFSEFHVPLFVLCSPIPSNYTSGHVIVTSSFSLFSEEGGREVCW
ncbi:hypothetical protein VNO77_22661 [Canavalia gladiata]|uniref:Uncharacterized protein n=1 Tax=Canavalia gladiata TaxID=3824 RepID=A0AAN9Q874_CANGL